MPAVGVAAFDFDGTLLAGDSFLPFLVRAVGPRSVMGAGPAVVRAVGALRDRDAAKAVLVRRLLHGYPAGDLAALGETYSAELVGRLRSSMTERVAWHRQHDHRLVLVSASLDAYLTPLGRRLGFDAVLATRLEVGADGLLTGRLQGPNVRGREKEARLRAWLTSTFDGATTEVWAYGDSAGDRELLAMADHPTLVSRRGRRSA
jgi:phosphatidylglycerophosphatase C